ncbi:MAG: NUDIX domain-containing protein [Allosphingosinicella sp.]
MPQISSGILMWRRRDDQIELLLGHFGGPMWHNKDDGAWAIPKGMIEPGESAEAAARREFREELGQEVEGDLVPLGRIRQRGGKWVEAFAIEGNLDPETMVSNSFSMEWPPRSGRLQSFLEIDAAAWFSIAQARAKILPSQLPLIDLFEQKICDKLQA